MPMMDNPPCRFTDDHAPSRDVALTYELLNQTAYGASRQKSVTDMEYSAGETLPLVLQP